MVDGAHIDEARVKAFSLTSTFRARHTSLYTFTKNAGAAFARLYTSCHNLKLL